MQPILVLEPLYAFLAGLCLNELQKIVEIFLCPHVLLQQFVNLIPLRVGILDTGRMRVADESGRNNVFVQIFGQHVLQHLQTTLLLLVGDHAEGMHAVAYVV